MSATKTPETTRLARELAKHFGEERFTARELAAELLALDAPITLLAALEDALARAAAAQENDELDDRLWGPAPTDHQLAGARRAAQAAVDEALTVALSGALSREEVGRRLGISPQAVSKRLAAGGLVALSRGREKRFPAWQFYEDGVLPGLPEVIEAHPGTPLSLTMWATSPSVDLDDRTPTEELAERGGIQRVLEAARALTPSAW